MNGLMQPWLSSITAPGESLALPVIYFDDFIEGGYAADAALADESDPSGKFSTTANRSPWLVTLIDGGSDAGEVIAISDDEHGGVLTLTANDADDDGISLQLNGEAFGLKAGRTLIFEARVKITDVSETDWFVGLATSDTAILSGVTDSIGFRCPDSTGDIDYVCEAASTETTADTTKDLTDATYVTLRFEVNGRTSVKFYVDGAFIYKSTTNIPATTAGLTPTLEVRNDGAVAQTLEVDYVLVAAERDT